ncbi:MAG: ArsR/SmtB family transcription factor, partial [Acidimicrobiales bacterium]
GLLPADQFMAGVETACTTVALEPPLRTESEHDRQVIWRRLGVLSSDKASRRRYLALLSDVLSTIETRWGASEAASMATAGRCAERASQGSAWRTLVDGGPNLDECLMTAREHLSRTDRLVVGISAFGKSVILDLPGAQLIGLRMVESASDARERSVALARRLKALADPTRLALLRLISESPQGVGSLARDLDLAQPTVSNHVKVLRESGLVRSMPSGGRHQLATDDDAIRKLLAETASLLEVSVP